MDAWIQEACTYTYKLTKILVSLYVRTNLLDVQTYSNIYICVSLYCQDQSRGSNYLVATLSQIYCPNFPPSSPPFIHLYSQSTFRAVGQKIFFKRLKSYHAGNEMKPPRKKTQSSNLQITKITRPSRSPKTPEAE